LNNNESKNMKTTHQQDKIFQEGKNKTFRQPAVAGQFYPLDKIALEKNIDEYLDQAEIFAPAGNYLPILILPHAGYEFSGSIAAVGFKQIQDVEINRVILLGRSHQHCFSGVSADTNDVWQTPLGDLDVDREWIESIKKYGFINDNGIVHQYEHSLEVMTPFIRKIFEDKAKIVPLLIGDNDGLDFQNIAQVLMDNIGYQTLLIISTDLSHYPDYRNAQNVDRATIQAVLSGNLDQFQAKMNTLKLSQVGKNNIDTLACAEPALSIAESLAEKLSSEPLLFKYANSGDIYLESQDRVVGYAAIGFYTDKKLMDRRHGLTAAHTANFQFADDLFAWTNNGLNRNQQEEALAIARQSIENYFGNRDYSRPIYGIFNSRRGVFVTLKKDGQLRGCIGNFEPDKNLAENIKEMALAAAFADPRLSSLQKDELKNINIEISVLSPMRKIDDPETIEVGKHGVYIAKGICSGVFLPQVATEEGWNREQFLDNLCEHKAGIDKNSWRDRSASLYIFTAQIFREGAE